jgi:glucose/arabinose dehydrogenase
MKKKCTLISLLLVSCFIIHAQKIKLVPFSGGYSNPVGIENCGDSRLFIVQQEGEIFICDSTGKRHPAPFLNITDRVLFDGSERGLLGLAFDPNYSRNSFFYVYYINKSGNTQVSRFKTKPDSPNVANPLSEKFILSITQPFTNHKGGCIRFGPDGYLYIGTGDGGSGGDPNNNAQNTQSLLGKMLRIDIHTADGSYKIPPDNPFVDSPNYKHEIWALGLRNPWRWSFDALNGKMFIADVGQDAWEEVDVQVNESGGHNYGWRCYEGKHAYNTTGCKPQKEYTSPKYEYPHSTSTGDCSIVGGFVYRGSKYPSLYGDYFFTDYCSGLFRALFADGGQGRVKIVHNGADNSYSSFGVDKNNEMYVCNEVLGKIYHITDTASQLNFSSDKTAEQNILSFSPNPSRGNINLSYTSLNASQVSIRITSILGQQVYTASKTVNAGNNSWNIMVNIPKGDYYLSVINSTGNIITQNLKIE